ncbi:hypothetical protein DFH94DRAFT_480016 [Russula ochroleuca]|jgi:paired amphipathic helix protein Sin3a|uniref:Uncharacterized protein n=1 Tax=Russula ochroleuca TaxID=152965 RepID=A0A9P5MWK2_9AGAM|nr:hypothetical protein DFH94DRAFT_480016 [Russula ochroleuca]
MAHKNLYEEALHQYDLHIDALVRTIGLFNKILGLTPEERSPFRLKSKFGGAGKALHQRIIYGRRPGSRSCKRCRSPPLALLIVLMRPKQKESMWKRAQREWNSIWRVVDAANYARSLDHQGITFKTGDKKALMQRALVAQI